MHMIPKIGLVMSANLEVNVSSMCTFKMEQPFGENDLIQVDSEVAGGFMAMSAAEAVITELHDYILVKVQAHNVASLCI